MTLQNVTTRFIGLSGLSQSESEVWSSVVCDAFEDIKGKVAQDCDTEENSRCLEAAAAALAFYNYKTVIATRREYSSFKAGDVSVSLADAGVDEARGLFERALEGCRGLFKDKDFVFGRVESLCTQT